MDEPCEIPAAIRQAAARRCREVIWALHARTNPSPGERAILGLFTRIAGSWDSLVALIRAESSEMHL